jgi:hypothetical protein
MPIWKEKVKVKGVRQISEIPDGAPLLHLKLFSLSYYRVPWWKKLLVLTYSTERQPSAIPQRWVETFHELLLLIVVPVCPSGSRTAKKCFDGRKSDLFLGSVLKLWYAEITNWKDNHEEGKAYYIVTHGEMGIFILFYEISGLVKILETGSKMLRSWLQQCVTPYITNKGVHASSERPMCACLSTHTRGVYWETVGDKEL